MSEKTVLCYGDSNTWGYDPATQKRYPRNVRWAGVLRRALGNGYLVIEEGLNGRTTVWDDPIEGYKNGKEYLVPCLETHKPIDLVIIMLGTNDLKARFHVPACDIAAGAGVAIEEDYYPGRDARLMAELIPMLVEMLEEREVNTYHSLSSFLEKEPERFDPTGLEIEGGSLDDIPERPGTYYMEGKRGELLYVGKAKNLKGRIGSYFSGSTNEKSKVEAPAGPFVTIPRKILPTQRPYGLTRGTISVLSPRSLSQPSSSPMPLTITLV